MSESKINEEEGGEEECSAGEALDVDEMDLGSMEDDEEEGEEEAMFSGGPRLDSEARKRLIQDYREVVLQIGAQNNVVDCLKVKVCEKSMKTCRTRCEERELRNIRCCLEKENLKLQCLLKRAMNLQEEDPHRTWEAIPIATTFEEDSMPMNYNNWRKKTVCDDSGEQTPCNKPCSRSPRQDNEPISKSDLQKFVACLMKQVKSRGSSSGGIDENILRKIACALQQSPPQPCKRHRKSDPCQKELHRSYSMQEQLAVDNSGLENDRYSLQEEILCRDKMIDGLQQKINCMQGELQQLCRDRQSLQRQQKSHSGSGQKKPPRSVQCMEKNIDNMETSMERLKMEMDCLRKERDRWESTVQKDRTSDFDDCKKPKTKSSEIEELKNNYTYLLAEYAKKDAELKEFKGRAKGFCESKHDDKNNVDTAELELLREKVTDMSEEQEEFKCLIKEQAEQLIEYQNKYLAAQQKVEEQKCILDKLEMNNKRIEDQINLEIQRIKDKFQEKLKELAQLPKLLENEQLKLASACKEKEDLERKLCYVCKELKAMKAANDSSDKVPDCSARLRQCETDLAACQRQYDDMKRDKDMLCDKLQKTKDDLDTLRSESAKIIARTKERANQKWQAQQERIDLVEKELAQCRASACLSISDREELIKEMQGQLSSFAYNFDSAQKQIKTLKNHIEFLSNESCNPQKC